MTITQCDACAVKHLVQAGTTTVCPAVRCYEAINPKGDKFFAHLCSDCAKAVLLAADQARYDGFMLELSKRRTAAKQTQQFIE